MDPSTAGGAFGFGVLVGTLLGLGVCGVTVWRSRTPGPEPPARADRGPGGGLLFPVPGASRGPLVGGFRAPRGERRHEAVDIMAPRGTPVLAMSDGTLERLSTSAGGGRGLYLRDATGSRCYYYAHLDRYAPGLKPGRPVSRGEVLGYVGTSGNASADAPHLHLAVLSVTSEQSCSRGTPVDPYPLLTGPGLPANPGDGGAGATPRE